MDLDGDGPAVDAEHGGRGDGGTHGTLLPTTLSGEGRGPALEPPAP
jgi:hypothetical protein